MQVIIGVDIGTTSTRAIVFDLSGKVLQAKYKHYPILTPQATHSEQDPAVIFAAVLSTLKDALAGVNQKELLGISFSSAMHSLLLVDAAGSPLTNVIIWADNRSQPQAENLRETPAGKMLHHSTGTPVHPMSPLCKLMWYREHEPELFNRAAKFISLKEYVFYKLFGKYLIDFSIASATGLFDIRQLTWFAPALALAGISSQQLSEPVVPTHQETGLNLDYAIEINLTQPVPFIIGASDGCLSNLSLPTTGPGVAALTIGTSGAIRVITPQPANDFQHRLFSYILMPNQFVVGGPVNNGGLILRWYRDTFGIAEKAEAREKGVEAYELLLHQAATVPPGADGLLFMPYLLGERAPIWDAQARGVFFGINPNHTKAHFTRALLEGIIFGVYQVSQALEETTGPIDLIYANGGFARSAFWVQLAADISGKKVCVQETVESSAWGAALLGLQALGIKPTPPEPAALPGNHVFLPNLEHHARYKKNFHIFEKLYPLLKEPMSLVSQLQETN